MNQAPKPNTIARQIVAMLLQRERTARQLRLKATKTPNVSQAHLFLMSAEENEAHNAAEIARRILYGLPL